MRFAGEAAESTVGTCRRTPRLPHSRNCTKDYVNNDNDADDTDVAVADVDNNDDTAAAVVVGDIDKDVGYGARTSWSPRRWILAGKSEP